MDFTLTEEEHASVFNSNYEEAIEQIGFFH